MKLTCGSSHFLSNLDRAEGPIAIQAAKETGYKIAIIDEATDWWGNLLPDSVALYSLESPREHGPFWKRFSELEEVDK